MKSILFYDNTRKSNANGHFYIRYAGCMSEDTPIGQHQADIQPGAAPSRFTNFYRCVQEVLLGKEFRIFWVERLECYHTLGDYQHRYQVDGREQVLKHFLGRAYLLNSQPGGHYRQYIPTTTDFQSYQHQDLNNAFNYMFDDLGPQQQPIDNTDPRFQQFNRLQNIYRTSGMLTKDLIKSVFIECNPTDDTFTPPIFHDLWPFPPPSSNRGDTPQSLIGVSGQVMQCLQPMVITTLGYLPAAAECSKFQDVYSLGTSEYHQVLGQLVVTDYHYQFDPRETNAGRPQFKTILIPHLDPGFVSYGSADPCILRFMFTSAARSTLGAQQTRGHFSITLRPWSSTTGLITIENTHPSTPVLFIQTVLVPECILRLIQEDRGGIPYAEAKTILHESVDFGKNYYIEEDDSNTDESD
ncbi:hypothetical protein BDA99DRAFT_563317 [Phascolomyces articulosus]|uniref:Restriction of telomere capping protein 4 C-terminal domain-containing protein n=1 Tax=Phascolomyces articulosus TaxID=60185 RepID=A0AAD5PAH4_9FUNG|nr:hypothetical protein BDA99DRAFT_563317 [Phascolomyces articulosus]